MTLYLYCRGCDGHGGRERTTIFGRSGGYPHGLPDYEWVPCSDCEGEQWVEYDEYYDSEAEALEDLCEPEDVDAFFPMDKDGDRREV